MYERLSNCGGTWKQCSLSALSLENAAFDKNQAEQKRQERERATVSLNAQNTTDGFSESISSKSKAQGEAGGGGTTKNINGGFGKNSSRYSLGQMDIAPRLFALFPRLSKK